MKLFDAFKIAERAHDGQFRKGPNPPPYIIHPMRVAIAGSNEDERVVGMLHDVIEDTDVTINDLIRDGLEPNRVHALIALTKVEGEAYFEYIDRVVEAGELAIAVKINDTHDNRADLPDEMKGMEKRYDMALRILEAASAN